MALRQREYILSILTYTKKSHFKNEQEAIGVLHDWAKVQCFRRFPLINYNNVIFSIKILPLTSMGLFDYL
jgi:hypothetical protein